MGILGQYLMVDESTLDYMLDMGGDELNAMIEELSKDETSKIYKLDRLWDGLHFLLTGAIASYPVEGDPLSEAVVGVDVLNDDDDDAEFVGCIQIEDLHNIVMTMKNVDLEMLKEGFDLAEFRKYKVYPKIWMDEDKDKLFDELTTEFKNLTIFYESALEEGMHIVITVY